MQEITKPISDFTAARDELGRLGVILSICPGQYRVNYAHGTDATAIYSDDLPEALETGRAMAEAARGELPPMGPTGRRNSRKGMMYRHNARIAAQRRRRGGRA